MKYKDKYRCARHPEYSIGRFYRSDLRKMVSLQQYYPMLFPDVISHDPIRFLGKLLQRENILFYSVKNGKRVEGYGISFILDASRSVEMESYRKKLPFSFKGYRAYFETQLEFLFEHLSIRKIYTRVPLALHKLVLLGERMGFVVEGVLRKDTIYDDKAEDVVILGMLREEF